MVSIDKITSRLRILKRKHMKRPISAIIISLLLTGLGHARTWTSADGNKIFEADFISSDDTSVTVKRGDKQMTFKLTLLSEADQNWVNKKESTTVIAEKNEKTAARFLESDFGRAFTKLKKFDGEKFDAHNLQAAPKYFLLYFSASW